MIIKKKSPAMIISGISILLCFVLASCTFSGTSSRTTRAGGDSKAVDAIDSVVITEMHNTDKVLAEWSSFEPDITVNRTFVSAEAVNLFINWSDQGGAIDLHAGDYFTFVIPSVFNHSRISDISSKVITDSNGETAATYSISTNTQGQKEVKVTFAEFVETHTDISGDFWLILYLGEVESTEIKNLEFIINGELSANGEVTVNPEQTGNLAHPSSVKYGYASPAKVVNGHYIFEWNVLLNTKENNAGTGFNILENYSFEDIIPSDSPHVFVTSAIANELNIPSSYQKVTIKEYTGSDLEPPEVRYQTFLNRYYYIGGDPWVNYLRNYSLANGVTSEGIDKNSGLNISNVAITNKALSATLGRLTRPTVISYYTVATIKMSEGSLEDQDAVRFFSNTFTGSNRENLTANLTKYYNASGGSATGIQGDNSFTFTKVNESGIALSGALYSLYLYEDLTGGAERFAISDSSGTVTFNNLTEGTYYFIETAAPDGYNQDNSIYKVEIGNQGYTIYFGSNFENRLSDYGNRIINIIETGTIEPVYATLSGTKVLLGKTLEDGIFSFILKDEGGDVIDVAKNDADGNIVFNALAHTVEGSYMYTVTEVLGNEPGIDYSDTVYPAIVTVLKANDGTLTATVTYPDGDILFQNTYDPTIEEPDVDPPDVLAPETESPDVETPDVEPPIVETPEAEIPSVETPAIETPEEETPIVEAPKAETTPGMETPDVLPPEAEAPVTEAPKTGDNNNIGLSITVLIASMALWTALNFKKNRCINK